VLLLRDLDEAKPSKQENSLNGKQGVANVMGVARIRARVVRWVLARDATDRPVDPQHEPARQWCANGALAAAGMCLNPAHYFKQPAVHRLEAAMGGNIAEFNNCQETVEPVLAAFDRAIAAGR
jgi:hypothetical protein